MVHSAEPTQHRAAVLDPITGGESCGSPQSSGCRPHLNHATEIFGKLPKTRGFFFADSEWVLFRKKEKRNHHIKQQCHFFSSLPVASLSYYQLQCLQILCFSLISEHSHFSHLPFMDTYTETC